MEQAFSQAFCRIAHVPGQTIISLDDDQYRLRSALSEHRLRSALSEAMGFPRINNLKKAFGIVSSGAVSLVTPMVVGLEDVVKMFLMWMHGVDLSLQVRASHDLICLDRGYMGPSLIEFFTECWLHSAWYP